MQSRLFVNKCKMCPTYKTNLIKFPLTLKPLEISRGPTESLTVPAS